jgi:type IV pilus assembly protein PilB
VAYRTFRPLLDALVLRGADAAAIEDAAEEAERSGRSIRDVLINDSVVTETELTEASAEAHGLPSVDLVTFPVDAGAVAKIPLSIVLRHRVLGIGMSGQELIVAISDPDDVVALDDIRAATGMTIRPMVAARSELRRLIDRLKRQSSDLGELGAELQEGDSTGSEVANLSTAGADAPIVRYVNSLLEQAIQNRASDLHLEPTEGDMRVRFRIDGVLHEVDKIPHAVQAALTSRLKIMASVDITERRVPQNGRITVRLSNHKVDLRVATLPTVWGEKVVLRVLDTGGIDLELRKLGFSDENYSRFAASFKKPHGMVLVTGPTGSGKSTTLYATLSQISSPERNIITVEDPVEYRLGGINQVQVNFKAGLTFAAVLPAILRSDPDVVMIGEIRDRVTAQLAVEAALTGHLVLSTLHTNDSATTPQRLVEMGVEPFLVGSAIDCIVAQRLARRLCEKCKEIYRPEMAALTGVGWDFEHDSTEPLELFRPVGCGTCGQTGYLGRFAIHEVLTVSEDIERLIVDHGHSEDIKKMAVSQGMLTLRQAGLTQVRAGWTSIEEILRVVA